MDVSAILEVLQSGGVLAGLILVVYGGMKRWWYWNHQYEDMRNELTSRLNETKQREMWWRSVALSSLDISERVVKGDDRDA